MATLYRRLGRLRGAGIARADGHAATLGLILLMLLAALLNLAEVSLGCHGVCRYDLELGSWHGLWHGLALGILTGGAGGLHNLVGGGDGLEGADQVLLLREIEIW